MTQAAAIFNQETRDKKRIARGANSKKTHNGKGGCSLPSDNLTKKQKEALNGECVSYRANKPMSFKEYQALPDMSRKYYLETLRQRYDARSTWIAEMMGCPAKTITREMRRLGVTPAGRGGDTSHGKRDEWDAFVFGVTETIAEAVQAVEVAEVAEVAEVRVSWDEFYELAKALEQSFGCHIKIEVSL